MIRSTAVNTKLLLSSSAVLMAVSGLILLFAPREFLGFIGADAKGTLEVIIQLHGAMLIAFAMVNWTAKDSRIGGIYNRSVSVGNTAHFVTGAITLLKAAVAAAVLWPAAIVYAVFAAAFAFLLFGSSPQAEL